MILNVSTFGYMDDTKCFGDVIECFINGDMTDDEMNNFINYKVTERGSPRQHVGSVHEGGWFPCGKCDCRAAEGGSLGQHVGSMHEGERYPCGKCDYKATQRGSLGQHMGSVHEGERCPCS